LKQGVCAKHRHSFRIMKPVQRPPRRQRQQLREIGLKKAFRP
jgi:hypothetical protein